MTHAIGKDKKGHYWFRSKQKLVDVTDVNRFFVEKRGFFSKRWIVVAQRIEKKGRFRFQFIEEGWIPPTYSYEDLGIYISEDEAATALECLMDIKEIDLISF